MNHIVIAAYNNSKLYAVQTDNPAEVEDFFQCLAMWNIHPGDKIPAKYLNVFLARKEKPGNIYKDMHVLDAVLAIANRCGFKAEIMNYQSARVIHLEAEDDYEEHALKYERKKRFGTS